jgi:hypothetical protein
MSILASILEKELPQYSELTSKKESSFYNVDEVMTRSEMREETLAEKIKENLLAGNKLNKSELLRESGYAPGSVDVFKKKSFLATLNEILPDELIIKAHRALIKNKFVVEKIFPKEMDDLDIVEICSHMGRVIKIIEADVAFKGKVKVCYIAVTNTKAATDGIDMAYKLKGAYAPEKHSLNINQDFAEMSDEELEEAVRQQEEREKKYKDSLSSNKRIIDITPGVVDNSEKVD